MWWPWGGFWVPGGAAPNPALGQSIPTYRCPADPRQNYAWLDTSDFNPPAYIGFTGYLGVNGLDSDFAHSGPASNGIFYFRSQTRFTDITDGTANTLMAGERPPSADQEFGWWFAGAGFDGSGEGDVHLGGAALDYAAALGCPSTYVGFQPGDINNRCDQVHFWSIHTGGGNFLMGDGSVRFYDYGMNAVIQALATRNGNEVANY